MRRDKLIVALQEIKADLNESGMVEMFRKAVESDGPQRGEKSQDTWVNLIAVTAFISKTLSYDDDKRTILKNLGLSDLAEPQVWQRNITELDRSFIYHHNQRVRLSLEIIGQIINLIHTDVNEERLSEVGVEDLLIQKIILTDEGRSFSAPDRLISLLESIRDLYKFICEVDGLKPDTLAVVRLDSGSEKSFDFLGIAKVIEQIKEILSLSYTMLAYHKQNVTLKNLEVATKGLEVFEKIDRLEKEKIFSSEDSQRVKLGLRRSIVQFVETGAYTPEMIVQQVAPEALMRPTQRLLAGPGHESILAAEKSPETAARTSNREPVDERPDDDYTEDELRAAIKALREVRKSEDTDMRRKPAKTARSQKRVSKASGGDD